MLLAVCQSASQFARGSDPACDLLSAPVVHATLPQFQFVKSFGGIICRIDELGATHPASLVIQDSFPGRLEQELPMLLKAARK